jgi:hypothetical protein
MMMKTWFRAWFDHLITIFHAVLWNFASTASERFVISSGHTAPAWVCVESNAVEKS